MKQVQQIAQVIWAEGFTNDLRGTALESYVKTELAKQDITEEKFNITVTDKGVDITAKENGGSGDVATVPENWKTNVTAIVDGVPIPKGFVASSATGENTKAGGLVIYEGTDAVTDANVDTARRTRNQYVWVPVSSENFTTKFVRQRFGIDYDTLMEEEGINDNLISNTLGSADGKLFWEMELDNNNMPLTTLSTESAAFMSEATLVEVQEMYASVKEYEGFYIARYEAGLSPTSVAPTAEISVTTGRENVHSMMAKIPYVNIPWSESNTMNADTNGAVEVARSLYTKTDSNYGVVSTLTYGVQWDATLQWWKDTDSSIDLTNSTLYGNHIDTTIVAGEINKDAQYAICDTTSYWTLGTYTDVEYDETGKSTTTKNNETAYSLTTGALEKAKVNNIYDMAGNAFEWTMEGNYADLRAYRGGDFVHPGISSVAVRGDLDPTGSLPFISFRPALYIK